jgi:hypothetical protein
MSLPSQVWDERPCPRRSWGDGAETVVGDELELDVPGVGIQRFTWTIWAWPSGVIHRTSGRVEPAARSRFRVG